MHSFALLSASLSITCSTCSEVAIEVEARRCGGVEVSEGGVVSGVCCCIAASLLHLLGAIEAEELGEVCVGLTIVWGGRKSVHLTREIAVLPEEVGDAL